MLARLFPHCASAAQRIGNACGGVLLFQFVFTSPSDSSWKETVPKLVGASAGLFSPTVVQARSKLDPLVEVTVTFSFVGVVLYALSVQEYSQVASAGWGSQLAAGVPSAVAAGTTARTSAIMKSTPPTRTASG